MAVTSEKAHAQEHDEVKYDQLATGPERGIGIDENAWVIVEPPKLPVGLAQSPALLIISQDRL
jgi:hypothetical protein